VASLPLYCNISSLLPEKPGEQKKDRVRRD
jgi:hypothetical protein